MLNPIMKKQQQNQPALSFSVSAASDVLLESRKVTAFSQPERHPPTNTVDLLKTPWNKIIEIIPINHGL